MRTLQDVILASFAKKAVLDFLNKVKKDRTKMQFLSGNKTYIVAAAMLVLAGLSFLGIDVPGVGHVDPVAEITAAIGLIFARGGSVTDAAKAVFVSGGATSVADAKSAIKNAGKTDA